MSTKDSPKEKSESRLLKRLSFWKGNNKTPVAADFEIVRNDQPEQWNNAKRLTLGLQSRIVFDEDGEVVQTERTQSMQTSTRPCSVSPSNAGFAAVVGDVVLCAQADVVEPFEIFFFCGYKNVFRFVVERRAMCSATTTATHRRPHCFGA